MRDFLPFCHCYIGTAERCPPASVPRRAPLGNRYAGSFAIGTMEEFGEAVTDNGFAFVGMDAFFAWGLSELRAGVAEGA